VAGRITELQRTCRRCGGTSFAGDADAQVHNAACHNGDQRNETHQSPCIEHDELLIGLVGSINNGQEACTGRQHWSVPAAVLDADVMTLMGLALYQKAMHVHVSSMVISWAAFRGALTDENADQAGALNALLGCSGGTSRQRRRGWGRCSLTGSLQLESRSGLLHGQLVVTG